MEKKNKDFETDEALVKAKLKDEADKSAKLIQEKADAIKDKDDAIEAKEPWARNWLS